MKKIVSLLILMLCGTIMFGCADKQMEENNSLAEKYSLETDCIEIYIGSPTSEIIKITDTDDIKALQKTVSFDDWTYVDPQNGEVLAGIESIFVKFNDSTTIAMYNDVPYGLIGNGTPDENGALNNTDAYYTFPQEFLDTVLQMIDKYSE